jgi:hypothetical protein
MHRQCRIAINERLLLHQIEALMNDFVQLHPKAMHQVRPKEPIKTART